jgi:hypothetical protein
MLRKKNWKTAHGRCETYVCKHSHKKVWKKCHLQYRVVYSERNFTIVTFVTEEDHLHEEDAANTTKENYHWTRQQEEIVLRGLRSNIKNTHIFAEMKREGPRMGVKASLAWFRWG